MNHSNEFWREVEKYYPYHKMARKMLRESQND
jgi:predicted metal-dependent hydrolase